MVIKKVLIHNFILFEDVEIELGEGVFFITGENLDESSSESNGAGKSSFVQAIIFCLFDDLLRKSMNKDDIIGSLDDYCRVQVVLEDDQREIVIDRTRNHPERGNDVTLKIDGNDISKHLTKDTNQEIEQLLVSSKVAYHCCFFDDSKKPLPSLTASKLNTVVSEILDTQRFDDYLKEVRREKRDSQTEVDKLSEVIQEKNNLVSVIEDDIQKFEEEIESFEVDKQQKVVDIVHDIEDSQFLINEYTLKLEDKKRVKERKGELEGKAQEVDKLNNQLANLKASKKKLDKKKVNLDKKYYDLEGKLKEQEGAYDNIFHNDSAKCNYCGNNLTNSDELSVIGKQIEKKRDKIKAELISVGVDRDDIAESLKDIKKEIKQKEDDISKSHDAVKEYNTLVRKLDKYESFEKQVKRLNKEIKQKEDEKKKVEKSDLSFLADQLDKKKQVLSEAREDVSSMEDRLDDTELSVKAASVLEDVLKETKAGVFNGFMVDLHSQINENLDELSNGDYACDLEEKGDELSFTFWNSSKDRYYSYHAFSKGERTRINKACFLALNQLLDVGFLIDDEGLNGLDAQGESDVLNFVTGKGDGSTFIFVSHSNVVNSHIEDGRNLHVVKKDGRSTAYLR